MERKFAPRKHILVAGGAKRISSPIQGRGRQTPPVTKTPFNVEVGRRLRATAREFGCETAVALAELLGAQRATVNAWFTGTALPPVPYMVRLCDLWRLTLDFIYRGDPDGIRQTTYLRIAADLSGERAPLGVAVDPSPEPEPASLPSRSSRHRQGVKAAANGTPDDS